MMSYADIYELDPCSAGREWLQECEADSMTLAEAWAECPDVNWYFWWLRESGHMTRELDLRLQVAMLDTPADGCTVRDLITDERSLALVALKERRLSGETIGNEEWAAAWFAADDAADAARDAARTAASDSAWAATRTAARAAWSVASDAAWSAAAAASDAAWVAAWSAASDSAADVARAAAQQWQARNIREIVGNPFASEEK